MAYNGSVPDTHARPLDWMVQAACAGHAGVFDDPQREHEARTICIAHCPVRSQCLAHIMRLEQGRYRNQREGVVAGLTSGERYGLDPTAPRWGDDPKPITFDGTERCGTRQALLRHLWRQEPIDETCWSGQVRRDRESSTGAPKPPAAAAAPEVPTTGSVPRVPPGKGGAPHERRVYRLWSQGLDDLQIARRMGIAVAQVERVRTRLGLLPVVHTKAG